MTLLPHVDAGHPGCTRVTIPGKGLYRVTTERPALLNSRMVLPPGYCIVPLDVGDVIDFESTATVEGPLTLPHPQL